MKKILVLAIITLSMCYVAFGQKAKPAAANKDLSVNQYFLQIPETYMNADTRKRAGWIDSDDNAKGYLEFTIPFADLAEDSDENGTSFGSMQLFKKKNGGVIVGLAINMCVENVCGGQLLLLDYNDGKWDNVTEKMAVSVDSDDDEEVSLAVEFDGTEKLIKYISGCKKTCDGGTAEKMFKWNGEKFAEFEYPEGLS